MEEERRKRGREGGREEGREGGREGKRKGGKKERREEEGREGRGKEEAGLNFKVQYEQEIQHSPHFASLCACSLAVTSL